MSYRFWFGFAVVFMFAFSADAAPSVRVLGGGTGVQTGSGTQQVRAANLNTEKKASGNLVRPASVRTIGATSVRPVAANAGKVNTGTSGASNVNRLSVGKYLHQAGVNNGVVKPVAVVEGAGVGVDAVSNLIERVDGLELKLNNKQDAFSLGDGLYMENGELGVDLGIADLIDQIDTLEQQMATKADVANYYTKSEVLNLLSQQSSETVDTIYDAGDNTRKYVSIVDNFDMGIFN